MRRFLKHYLLIVYFIILFSSCEEVVVIDLDQIASKYVIEGLQTQLDTFHYVKLTQSIDFYDNDIQAVDFATVVVTSGAGEKYTFSHNPDYIELLKGYYFSDQKYAGKAYETYTLDVEINGEHYLSMDTLRPVTTIDSLSYRVDDSPFIEKEEGEVLYQVLLYAQEPQETEDYYYFKFFRDLVPETDGNIYNFDDSILGDNLNGLPSPISYRAGDYASVDIYSITKKQFVYLTDLATLLTSDGGMFSPPPANPRGNISNGALGMWQVSSVTSAGILIE